MLADQLSPPPLVNPITVPIRLVANGSNDAREQQLVEDATERVGRGEQIVVFVHRAQTAELLVNLLTESGIKAASCGGAQEPFKRAQHQREFQAGSLDVIVTTRACESGIAFSTAKAVIHYDLPRDDAQSLQRAARVVRCGNKHETVDVVFYVAVP